MGRAEGGFVGLERCVGSTPLEKSPRCSLCAFACAVCRHFFAVYVGRRAPILFGSCPWAWCRQLVLCGRVVGTPSECAELFWVV